MVVIVSCTPDEMTQQELITFLKNEKNGLIKQVKSSGTTLTVSYRPSDLLVAQELEANEKTAEELKAKYAGKHYFILGFSREDGQGLMQSKLTVEESNEIVSNLAFRVGSLVNLTTQAGDTIQVSNAIFERDYGLSRETSVLLAFKKVETAWLQINLLEFGLATGRQSFRFYTNDIEAIPVIKLQ